MSARLTHSEGRKFGLQLGIAFLVIGGLFWWRQRIMLAAAMGVIGGLLLLSGMVIPTRLGPVQGAWMGLAHAISKVTTPVLMGITYFVVLVPIGLVMRLFRRDPLLPAMRGGTFWVDRSDDAGRRGDLTRQF